MAAAASNLGVLGVSLITPQQDTPAPSPEGRSDYSDRCVGQMNNLVHGMATAAGRVMSLATVASLHVWLGLTALAKKDRDDLLGAPVSTEGLCATTRPWGWMRLHTSHGQGSCSTPFHRCVSFSLSWGE